MVPPGPLVTAAQLAAELPDRARPPCSTVAGGSPVEPTGPGTTGGTRPGRCSSTSTATCPAPLAGQGGRHPLPDPAAFQAAMRRAGVGAARPVVAYDQGEPGGAARAWWLLGWLGHPDVRVLDGGLPAWVAAGLPLATGAPDPDPGDFSARPARRSLLDAAGAARPPPAASSWTPGLPASHTGLRGAGRPGRRPRPGRPQPPHDRPRR